MRNATVTTIAPTGTISIIANASSGVEPLFAVSYIRTVMDKNVLVEVNPIFERIAKERGFYSEELMQKIAEHGTVHDIDEMPADIRTSLSLPTTSARSTTSRCRRPSSTTPTMRSRKTVNFSNTATIEDVEKVYMLAYRDRLQGRHHLSRRLPRRAGALDRQERRDRQQLPRTPIEEDKKAVKRERPKALKGWTYQMQTGCGPLYITINEDKNGLFELFTTMGKAGGCAASQSEAIGRMVSLAWRSGVQARQVVKQLLGISCHCPSGFGDNRFSPAPMRWPRRSRTI